MISESELPAVEFNNSDHRITTDRPLSARSVSSSGSKTARATNIKQSKATIKNFFAHRPGLFESSVEICQRDAVKPDLDGSLIGAWLLTEIDHWDCEKEKVVLLTDSSLIVCKFDFVAQKVLDSKRLMLHNVRIVAVGNLVYPEKSLMPVRTQGGVR